MKQSIKIILLFIGVMLVSALTTVILLRPMPASNQVVGGTAATVNRIIDPVTNSSVDVSASTSTLVLPANMVRQYAAIVNDSANTVWLSLGTAALADKGITLNANGGSYEINPNNAYIGNVYAIASSTTSTLTTVEK